MRANIESNWESDWGIPQDTRKYNGNGPYKGEAEPEQGNHLIGYSLRLPDLGKPNWLFAIKFLFLNLEEFIEIDYGLGFSLLTQALEPLQSNELLV